MLGQRTRNSEGVTILVVKERWWLEDEGSCEVLV